MFRGPLTWTLGLFYRELLQISRAFLKILVRSIAESTYGRAKIFKNGSKGAARLYKINPKSRFLRILSCAVPLSLYPMNIPSIEQMTLEEKVGQLLIAHFHG